MKAHLKKKRKNYWKWIGGGGCLLGIIYVVILCVSADKAPVEKMNSVLHLLSKAEALNADIYSKGLYDEARELYDSAVVVWRKENQKLFVFRKYQTVEELVGKATEVAGKAIQHAEDVRKNTRKELVDEIAGLRQEMADFEKLFVSLPLANKYVREHSRGKLLLNEAEIAFEKGDYQVGRQKLRSAAEMIRSAYRSGHDLLDEYFKQLPEWQESLQGMIAQSERDRDYFVLVTKIPAQCIVYYKGKPKYSFAVEFGKNWLGNKQCEGDNATPEGKYHIVKRLEGRLTRYYKALLLDYPNAEDLANFARLKKKGILPRTARPGGLIEIHGDGGKGANWTNGCVALENNDMDTLFRSVSKGTPVLIIGGDKKMEWNNWDNN